MIDVERTFLERFPVLSGPSRRFIAAPVLGLLRRITCEARLNALLVELDHLSGFDFVEQALTLLGCRYSVANTDIENIPVSGRVLVVANHPLGARDALALLDAVGRVRRDVRIFANELLSSLKGLRDLVLPVDVFGSAGSVRSARAGIRHLEAEGVLIVFPAGEVSRLRAGGIRDRAWDPGFVRIAQRACAPVLPVHLGGRNSSVFYGLSVLARPLSGLLLPREMLQVQHRPIHMDVGAPIASAAISDPAVKPLRIAARLRRHVYSLARPRRRPVFTTTASIAHPEPRQQLRRELELARSVGQTSDGKRICLFEGRSDSSVLREIGRLRELAFRKVGEGSGARRDLDRFDPHYQHIALWDDQALEIAGAYRLGEAARLHTAFGGKGLYSATLFDFQPGANAFLGSAVELGRSFVQPAYWGTRSLDYLWQGIGAWLRLRPDLRWLFGPVSLSAALPAAARDLIVSFHAHYYPAPAGLARARNPFQFQTLDGRALAELWAGLELAEGQRELKQRLAGLGTGLPVLYRQYADLCEPDGVSFLTFGVDPGFGHCVDGLVRLDLERLKPARRARYLGL